MFRRDIVLIQTYLFSKFFLVTYYVSNDPSWGIEWHMRNSLSQLAFEFSEDKRLRLLFAQIEHSISICWMSEWMNEWMAAAVKNLKSI